MYYRKQSLVFAVTALLAFPAQAKILNSSYASFPPSGGGATCLQGESINIIAEWDATVSDSYSGSGSTWTNLTSEGSTYDLTINGATFTGSAGDAAAYFSLDGSDNFTLSGALTTFIKNIHKTTGGEDFWFALAHHQVSGATNQGLFSTQSGAATAGNSTYYRASEVVRNTPPNTNFTAVASDATNYVMLISHSHSTNQTTVWLGTTTGETLSQTFTTSTDDGTAFEIASYAGGTSYMNSGTRIYAASLGNTFLNDTQAAAIFSCYETDHARDYTP